jgi:GntR family transcriptional regulator, transcriptional repressor for pyruvate dehydrogenase complex
MGVLDDGVFPYGLGRVNGEDASGLAGTVVQQLEMALTVGLLSDGDRLPSEVELAAQMGVSTVTLRQALTILRNRGIIETRRGRGGGSFIRDASGFSRHELEAQLRARSVEELRDLGDACASAAGSAARLAALRALPEEAGRLEGRARQLSLAQGSDACRRADSRFHIGLGYAAQSPRLTALIVQLQAEFAPLLWAPGSAVPAEAMAAEAAREHALIVEAIRARDAAEAQTRTVLHCEREARTLIARHLKLAAA